MKLIDIVRPMLKEATGQVGYVVCGSAPGSNGNGAYKANNWFMSLEKAKKYFEKASPEDFSFSYGDTAEQVVLAKVPTGILNRRIAKGRGGFLSSTDLKIIEKK
jgi:hypothetical protein